MEKVTKLISTSARCSKDIVLHGDVFQEDKIYEVMIEIKGDILEECYSEYVYVNHIRLIAEDFFENFELLRAGDHISDSFRRFIRENHLTAKWEKFIKTEELWKKG